MGVKGYFDSQAESYDGQRSGGPIGGLVKKEEQFVSEFLDVQEGDNILDVGCGSGHYAMLMKESGGTVFGIDVSDQMIEKFKAKGFEGVVGSMEDVSLGKTFDKVLCAGAMEFMEQPDRALLKINSVLKQSGVLVCVYPKKSIGGFVYRLFHKTHGVNIKLFSKNDIQKLLKNSGFTLEKVKKSNPITNVFLARKV